MKTKKFKKFLESIREVDTKLIDSIIEGVNLIESTDDVVTEIKERLGITDDNDDPFGYKMDNESTESRELETGDGSMNDEEVDLVDEYEFDDDTDGDVDFDLDGSDLDDDEFLFGDIEEFDDNEYDDGEEFDDEF